MKLEGLYFLWCSSNRPNVTFIGPKNWMLNPFTQAHISRVYVFRRMTSVHVARTVDLLCGGATALVNDLNLA